MKLLTFKEEKFLKETLKTLNPTEAVRRTYNLGSKNGSKTLKKLNNTASVIASQNLRKLHLIRAIKEELEEQELNDEEISTILKENIFQRKNISASNAAIDIYHKLKGNYSPEKKENINLNLTGKELEEAIQERLDELKKLSEMEEGG